MTQPTPTYIPGTCVLTHYRDAERPRQAIDGALVCWGCHAKTVRAFAQLEPLHRLLGEVCAVGTAAPRNGPRSADTPIPLHEVAAGMRRTLRVKMAGWIPVVTEERGLVAPLIDAADGADPAMAQIMGWLAPHHDWLLYEDPEGWAADLVDLRHAAWGLAYPTGKVRRQFAPCPAENGCGGTLTAHLAPGDLLPAALRCDACGAEVPPSRWLAGRPGRTLTAVELSALWDVPLKTVERWARVAAWPSDGGRPARYDTLAAQRTLDVHRGALTQVTGVSHAAASIEAL